MYDDIPTILTPEELLDKALGRASKIQKEDREYFYRVKKTTIAKIESQTDVLVETLQGWVRKFPNLDRITTYERELFEVILGVRSLQRALSRVEGASETIRSIGSDALAEARRVREKEPLFEIHRRVVGRTSSVVRQLDQPLRALADARAILHRIPTVSAEDATIVLAGYPNVGKSSLLAVLTNAHPEIAPYPFTTKQVNIGHFSWPPNAGHRAKRYQLVDTPGLLEKQPQDRNKIEKQAALALAFLADLILFVHDPSEACGYTRDQQLGLLTSVRKEFAGIPLIEVETKGDLPSPPQAGILRVSATTRKGLDELRAAILAAIPKDRYEGMLPEADPFGAG